jgi:hypothetical protein
MKHSLAELSVMAGRCVFHGTMGTQQVSKNASAWQRIRKPNLFKVLFKMCTAVRSSEPNMQAISINLATIEVQTEDADPH